MTDEISQAETPDVQESAVPETSETPTPDEDQEHSAPDTEQDGGDEGSEEPEWFQKRINQITAKSKAKERQYETRVQQAERELAELKQRLAENTSAPAKPKAEDYETNEDFVEALADWKYEQRKAEEAKSSSETQKKDQSAEAYQKSKAAWESKEAEFVKEHPDYDDVVEEFVELVPQDSNSAQIVNRILGHERGPEILYALAKDQSLAEDLFSKPHTFAARKLETITAEKPQPKKLPKPPSQIKTGSSKTEESGEELARKAGII